jgi:hypothetical protein
MNRLLAPHRVRNPARRRHIVPDGGGERTRKGECALTAPRRYTMRVRDPRARQHDVGRALGPDPAVPEHRGRNHLRGNGEHPVRPGFVKLRYAAPQIPWGWVAGDPQTGLRFRLFRGPFRDISGSCGVALMDEESLDSPTTSIRSAEQLRSSDSGSIPPGITTTDLHSKPEPLGHSFWRPFLIGVARC